MESEFRFENLGQMIRRHLRTTIVTLAPIMGSIPVAFCGEQENPLDEEPAPLHRAHAHNDYRNKRPLLDALDRGFCSVEVDIFLRGQKFHVAHTRFGIRKDRTLEEMYLKPLAERVKKNKGVVLPRQKRFILLIDIKDDGNEAYPVLDRLLTSYGSLFTAVLNGKHRPGPITAILSGARPRALVEKDHTRYCALDGRPGDLGGKAAPDLIPLISDKWSNHFKWRGRGPFPPEERQRLEEFVKRTQKQGRILRFWAVPDRMESWKALYESGVDLINTDKLEELALFLRSNE